MKPPNPSERHYFTRSGIVALSPKSFQRLWARGWDHTLRTIFCTLSACIELHTDWMTGMSQLLTPLATMAVLVKSPSSRINDGVGHAGGYAGKSSVKDFLLSYQGFRRAKQDQAGMKQNRTPGLPCIHTNTIGSPHIGVGTSAEKLAYCIGRNCQDLSRSPALTVGSCV